MGCDLCLVVHSNLQTRELKNHRTFAVSELSLAYSQCVAACIYGEDIFHK